ncbi:restriction endonuclease subunit S [Clostridium botulinum]|uniref:restriction endonuclease subunit S n=1 Tax=Clostridium botulinum TaxID=1491 RepID=UPI001C9AC587|nr:restriction endonuclease subunit S [Clostridium botulinum]MBY6811079.1 restriction endonuclease subunit S [Clostridium botulinum]MBY6824547.1 restriction endonuclease subunit S [Clostridium botulinum]MBY6834959.1 restriction endonuclease subunit S [Clostridium botulinum]MBY6974309.1 restriction endonuclease subunit S [Clostridium botulinum]
MNKNKVNVPKIRFPGFTDPWEQRKLGDSVNFLNGRAYKQSELLDEGKYRVLRVGNFNTNDKWYYSDIELEDNKYAVKSDLLYLWATNFGPEIWNEEKVIYHYHIWKLDITDENIDKRYLYTWLETDKERIKQNTNGSTMVHITKGNMEEREFQFPTLLEQQQIGSIFQRFDNLITLHQRKLNHLQDKKKGLLQKMFPNNGEKFPELRFPGFTDPWEQRKLGDIVQITMGQSPNGSTYSDTPSGYILVQGNADLKNGWVTPRVWTSQITKKAEAGDLIMSVRAPAGEIGKTAHNVVIGRGVAAIKGNEFIFQSLVKMNGEGYWKKLSCGSTFESLNSDNIKNAKIMVSNLDEQAQIGAFFKTVDNIITLHQRKLEHLQQQKKGLLQQMFI